MITKEQYAYLKNNAAFLNFSVEAFDEIAANITCRTVPKGQILFFDGENRENLFLISKGFVRIEQYDKNCTFTYVDYVKEDSLFPYGGMFNDKYYHYSGIAITNLEYFKIPVQLYEKFSLGNDLQLAFIINKLSKILEFQELRLRSSSLVNAHDRIISTLAILYYDFCKESNQIPFPISLTELSKLSCTSRETTAHVIKELQSKSIIEYEKKIMIFKNNKYFLEYLDKY